MSSARSEEVPRMLDAAARKATHRIEMRRRWPWRLFSGLGKAKLKVRSSGQLWVQRIPHNSTGLRQTLHERGNWNSHPIQQLGHLPTEKVGDQNAAPLTLRIGLLEDRIAMVKAVEFLRQYKGVFG